MSIEPHRFLKVIDEDEMIIDILIAEMDQFVYKLYDLTPEEIKIVEDLSAEKGSDLLLTFEAF